MDSAKAALLRELLSSTGWTERTRWFAKVLRQATTKADPLLLVGTPTQEPWHFAAHLTDEAQFANLPGLRPTLIRHDPPAGAPPHLAVGLDRLRDGRRGETLFVVAPDAPQERLLDRIEAAKRSGLTILSMDNGNRDLADLSHEQLVVPAPSSSELLLPDEFTEETVAELARAADSIPAVSFGAVEHLVSLAAGEPMALLRTGSPKRAGRLSRVVEDFTVGRRSSQW